MSLLKMHQHHATMQDDLKKLQAIIDVLRDSHGDPLLIEAIEAINRILCCLAAPQQVQP